MKNLDIEKLERKNVYKVPEHFFSEMQENVLRETINKKRAKVFKMNWVYLAAAAIALVFGLTFIFMNNENPTKPVAAITKTEIPSSSVSVPLVNHKKELVVPQNQNSDKTVKQTIAKNTYNIESKQIAVSKIVEKQTSEKIKPSISEEKKATEKDVEQILANIPDEEIASLANNSEQDVYLDLYN